MDKVLAIEEIPDLINDGDCVAIGGTWLQRKPMAILREIVRARKRELEIIIPIGGIDADLLIGAGCAKKIHFSYISLDIYGSALNFRRAVEKKEIEFEEYSSMSIFLALKAAAKDLPYLTMKELLGSDIPEVNKRHEIFADNTSGDKIVAVKKVKPNIAILHAQRATEDGTVLFAIVEWYDLEMAKGAEKVVVSVEEIISKDEITNISNKHLLLKNIIDALVIVPFGAHPTSCYPYYVPDFWHLFDYVQLSRDPAYFRSYLRKYIFSVASHEEYLEAIGGNGKIRKLKDLSTFGLHHGL